MSGGTTVERLARIEALLERHMEQSTNDRKELLAKIEKLETRLTEIEGYKNRAYGMLIAFGLVAGSAGAGLAKAVSALFQ
jgi:flagellar biosynthesis chaperone FliJ